MILFENCIVSPFLAVNVNGILISAVYISESLFLLLAFFFLLHSLFVQCHACTMHKGVQYNAHNNDNDNGIEYIDTFAIVAYSYVQYYP